MRRKKEKISLVLFLLFLKVSWIKVKNNHIYLSQRNQKPNHNGKGKNLHILQ